MMQPPEERMRLDLQSPTIECGSCHFGSTLNGTWAVENGRLVWRGDDQLQTGRGPDLRCCVEGREVHRTVGIDIDWGNNTISDDDFAALLETDRVAREAEETAWNDRT
jgi:hypothetical protein